uniref:Uncharacterized protein n=1 Tax=Tanacetum cinerariifolium TaxID=118510 RepID=A0A6L2P3R2_TANCI|nr:hypothetical protein [Tanacetum cinerariifolium]
MGKVLDIISLFNIPRVTHDAVMLRVFPITLTGVAKRYYPPSKTVKQLEEICKFKQEGDETLYQAWERYNNLLYKCPTYGINSHQKEEDDIPSGVLPCQLPPKELNPGSFILPCTIGRKMQLEARIIKHDTYLNVYFCRPVTQECEGTFKYEKVQGVNTNWWHDHGFEDDERQESGLDMEEYDPLKVLTSRRWNSRSPRLVIMWKNTSIEARYMGTRRGKNAKRRFSRLHPAEHPLPGCGCSHKRCSVPVLWMQIYRAATLGLFLQP